MSQPFRSPAHEAVARAEHVEDLDREAGAAFAIVQAVGDRAGEGDAPIGPRLQTSVASETSRTARSAASVSVVPPAIWNSSSVPTIRSKSCEVALQLGRHGIRGDEAAFAGAVARQPPEVRAVVDVERDLQPMLPREGQRLQHRRFGARVGKMRAGHHQRPGGGDERLVDVVLAKCHVGAILAVEDQRELMLVADAEQHQSRQPLRVGLDALNVHAFARQLLADEAAHMLVADPRDDRRPEAQPRCAGRDVGGRAADIFGERAHILKPPADLRAVEVDGGAADGDDIERFHDVSPALRKP